MAQLLKQLGKEYGIAESSGNETAQNISTPEEQEAAIKLQASVRGMQARKVVVKVKKRKVRRWCRFFCVYVCLFGWVGERTRGQHVHCAA